MKRVLSLSCLGLWLASCSTTLSGKLTLDSQKGPQESQLLENARVNVTALEGIAAEGRKNIVLKVNEKGEFETSESLKPGRYLVEALVPGFHPSSQTIDIKESKKISLQLRPLQSMNSKTIDVHNSFTEGRGIGGANLTPPQL